MNMENKIDIFDRYLRDEMASDERAMFEQQLQNDQGLKDEFNTYKKDIDVVKIMGLRAELKNLMEADQSRGSILSQWYVWLPVAASIILLIGYFWFSPATSDQELFITYYQPYPNVITTRSAVNPLTSALSEYSNQRYQQSNQLLADITPATDTVYFYRGLVYLSMSKPDSAVSYLLKSTPSSVFQQQVNWYAALSYLSKGDRSNAVSYLKKIESGQFNFDNAQKLLTQISPLH